MFYKLVKENKFKLLLLLLLFLVLTDNQSYKLLYGEDSTWINGFLKGDIYKSLFPRGNFLVLGASIPQLICAFLARNLTQYTFLKFLSSYLLIFLVSFSCFFNKFLSQKIRLLLAVFCIVPLTKSVDFEVFGHLHNLSWYFPVLTLNILTYILYILSEWDTQKKKVNIKLLNFIFIIFFLSSFLFPICAILVLFSQLFFIIIKTNHIEEKLFINNKIYIISTNLFLFIYLITINDRSGSIIQNNINNLNILKISEFIIRVLNEPFTSLFTHNNYIGSYLLMIFAVLVISLMNLIIYLDTFINSFKIFFQRKRPFLTNQLVNFFLILLFLSNTFIFSFSRLPELSFFLRGLTNSPYPERYYLFQNYINTIIIFTILSNNINTNNIKNSTNTFIFYIGKYSKFSYYRFQKKCFSIILLVLISISLCSRLGGFFFSKVDNSREIYNSCYFYKNNIYVEGFPKIFKTIVPKESIYFKNALERCRFIKN